MAKLENLCRSYRDSGLYTDVYVACGFLDDDKNYYDFGLFSGDARVFDLASLTKALVTTPLVLWRCYERGMSPAVATLKNIFGQVSLDQVGATAHDMTLAAYLRHETGLPAWRNFYTFCRESSGESRQTLRDALRRSRITRDAKDVYSDVGFLTLGALLASSANESLVNEWRQQTVKYGIDSSDLGAGEEFSQKNVISTGFCPVRQRRLVGEVHDENCWALGGFCGHAGLFGSGPGVTDYLRAMWQSRVGKLVFHENFKEQISPGDSLMGWRKGNDTSSKTFADGRGCGHMGFTGTAFWVDPVSRSYAVVLTNRIISGRVSSEIKTFRAEAFRELWELIRP